MLAELNEVLDTLNQQPLVSPQRVLETSSKSNPETENSRGRRKILLQKTLAIERGRFFLTGPTDADNKPSHYDFRICRKDASVLTRGHQNFLRHFQGLAILPATNVCAFN